MNCRHAAIILLFIAPALPLMAQRGGFIAGVVRDRSGLVVPDAELLVQSQDTGARRKLRSDAGGHYETPEMAAGGYKLTVRRDGFRTLTRADLNVQAGKTLRTDFVIDLLPVQGEITVTASASNDDPMVSGLTVSRDSPTNSLPSNGRDLHALFALIPGATVTPAAITSGGQFTVGGQRPNANSFRVDGLSANVGIGIISVPGAFPGGTLPGMTTIGGLQSLASKDEMERVEMRSADFSAQSGDRPGAQIDLDTRTGDNDFHASLFGYLRPHSLNSTDWFARGAATGLPTPFLNGWGGSVGGPAWRNRTFFFASFERSDVHDSALQVIPVPSLAARAAAGAPYQALLDAFPVPAGNALNATEALGYSPLRKVAAITNSSVRIDQSLSEHIRFFGRYSNVPSSSTSIELGTAYSAFGWQTATGGLTVVSGNVLQDMGFNFSRAVARAEHGPFDTPAVNLLSQTLFNGISAGSALGDEIPAGTSLLLFQSLPHITEVSIAGIGQTVAGQAGQSSEEQMAGAYGVSKESGRHLLRAGANYTNLIPSYAGTTEIAIASPGINDLLSGVPLGITSSDFVGPQGRAQRWSFFGQDTLHLTDRLNLLVGLRWELTVPSSTSFNGQGISYYPEVEYWRGIGTLPVQVAGLRSPLGSRWPMRYDQFAPRMGLAYHLKSPNVVVRAGAGLFYDTQMGSIISNENPLSAWQYLPGSASPPADTSSEPAVQQPVLYLPRVWEWRTSIEKSLHETSLVTISYFGSAGRRLLRNEATQNQQTQVLETLTFNSNASSDYQALLLQFHVNLSANLYATAGYTWAHSIDTGSSDTAPFLVQAGANNSSDRGSSSFDIRHSLTASLNYKLNPHLGRILGGWNISSTAQARTGFPFDVTTVDRSVNFGFDNSSRANLVPGQSIWINDDSVPGGRRLNPLAFEAPSNGLNGNLGRNVLTGPGLFQIDASLRRDFHLRRNVWAETAISAYNVLNHPAFANPVSYLGSALFGQSTSTANLMLGSGSPTTGLTPLFQAGGPRTIELSLKFRF